eukprot:4441666-Alexandrium_andersonii.AAC.1
MPRPAPPPACAFRPRPAAPPLQPLHPRPEVRPGGARDDAGSPRGAQMAAGTLRHRAHVER